MKERQFIKQSEKKWKNFEQDLKTKAENPKKISNLFVQITDDLSYARTFYPNRMVRKYLDGVSQVLLQRITKSERNSLSKFLSFWLKTLPLTLFEARKSLRVSTVVFLCAMAIGVISSIYEPEFARVILGDGYVEMTEANIDNDDPMAVYKEFNAFEGFVGITINNIRVAFITFMFGIIYAIGSILVLIYNGVMVGAFQYFFIERGLFWESFLTIWQHGTLEISAIIIAGGAGITMGKGLIYTGIYSRLQSFKISGKKGFIILVGTIPLFIIAGFIEGFLTRATEVHPVVRISVIILSLAFILYYYSWYPRYVKNNSNEENEEFIPPEESFIIEFKKKSIQTVNGVLRSIYTFTSLHSNLLWMSVIFSAVFSYALISLMDWTFLSQVHLHLDELKASWSFFWLPCDEPILILLLSLSVLILSVFTHYYVDQKKESLISYLSLYKILNCSLFTLLLLGSSYGVLVLIWVVIFTGNLMLNFIGSNTKYKTEGGLKSISKIKSNWGAGFTVFFGIIGINAVFLLAASFINSIVFSLALEFVVEDELILAQLTYGIYFFIIALYALASHFMISAGNYYIFHSNEEKKNATGLLEKIDSFKSKYNLTSE